MTKSPHRSRRLAALIAGAVLAAPLAFGSPVLAEPGKSKGDERPETAPGQTKEAQQPAQPEKGNSEAAKERKAAAKEAKATEKSQRTQSKSSNSRSGAAKAKSKSVPAQRESKAKSHSPSPHAKAGKTTICHSTGSATNPFVMITISNNALDAHRRHHDGRDLVPAPASGCPSGTTSDAKGTAVARDNDNPKVTICHATGSATNPFVKITISENAVKAHERHQDGRDLIPAPEGDCSTPVTTPGAAVLRGVATTPLSAVAPLALTTPVPQGAVLGAHAESSPAGAGAPAGAVAGVVSESRVAGADAAAARSGSLPFTGSDLIVLVLAGLAALIGGYALRRSLLGSQS